jgi:hypothetical protein
MTSNLKRFWKWIVNISDDFLAYVITLGMILLTGEVNFVKEGSIVAMSQENAQMLSAGIAAFIILKWQESLDETNEELKARSKEGRKKHFNRRMVNAFMYGLAAPRIIEMIFNQIVQ